MSWCNGGCRRCIISVVVCILCCTGGCPLPWKKALLSSLLVFAQERLGVLGQIRQEVAAVSGYTSGALTSNTYPQPEYEQVALSWTVGALLTSYNGPQL